MELYLAGGREDERLEHEVRLLFERLQKIGAAPCDVVVVDMPQQHCGLGSKTSVLLSTAVAIADFSNLQLEPAQLIALSGRGGTSGIGINTFFLGGVIADSGHSEPKHSRNFAPSSRRMGPASLPKVVARVEVPDNMRVLLFIDTFSSKIRIQGNEEMRIFAETMPLKEIENLRSLAAVYHGVIPALQEGDMNMLFQSIRDLNSCGMKQIEVNLQSNITQTFIRDVWSNSIPCGVSSFGPIVFCIVNANSDAITVAMRLAHVHNLTCMGLFAFDNTGAISERS